MSEAKSKQERPLIYRDLTGRLRRIRRPGWDWNGQKWSRVDDEKALEGDLRLEAGFIIREWASTESYMSRLCRVYPAARAGGERKRESQVAVLRKADSIMRQIAPIFKRAPMSRRIPSIILPDETVIPASLLLSCGALSWFADFVARMRRAKGRPSEWAKTWCAEELLRHFKKRAGRPRWSLLYDCMARQWKDLPPLTDAREKKERINGLLKYAKKSGVRPEVQVNTRGLKPFPLPGIERPRTRKFKNPAELRAFLRVVGIRHEVAHPK
jgi:hypothetical protein